MLLANKYPKKQNNSIRTTKGLYTFEENLLPS